MSDEIQRPQSPTQEARFRAAEGAAAAAAAARVADELNWRTRRSNDSRDLYNTKVPRVPLSDSAFEAEKNRTAPPATIVPSAYCQEEGNPAALHAPSVRSLEETQQLAAAGAGDRVDTIRLNSQLSPAEATMLSALVANPDCIVRTLSLSNAVSQPIAADPSLIAPVAAEIRAEFPEQAEETAEKLQAAVEKLKGEFTTYEAAIEFLAMKRIDPLKILFTNLSTNTSVKELRLDNNQFGAPNGEGKCNYQPLRRLAKLIDINSTIRVLDLSANQMGPVGIGIVAKALTKNISIHSLDISGNELIGEPGEEEEDPEVEEEDPVFGEVFQSLEALSEVIKKNKFLKKISMRHNRLKAEIDEAGEDDGVETPLGKFLEPFKKFHRVQVLDLSSNELGAAGARMVVAALAQNRSVRLLDLSDNNIGPRGLHYMALLLKQSKSIESLVLQKNDLSGKKGKRAQKEAHATMLEFAASLAANTSLKAINISGNHLGPDLAADFLSTLAQCATRLEKIHLESNEICALHPGDFDDRAIRCIGEALGVEGCQIRDLNLAGNHIQAQGIQVLVEAGRDAGLTSVMHLNLSRNSLGDFGVSVLGPRLPLMTALSTIDLSYNTILDPTPLTLALHTTQSIRQVLLSHNLLGDCKATQALVNLIDAISNRPQFEVLDLGYNELTNDHAKALAFLCHSATPPFQSLKIDGNPAISIGETIKMIQALARNTSIRTFKTSAQEGDHYPLLQALQQTLQQNKTLEDVDVGLSLDVMEETDMLTEIKRNLLQNALNAAGVAQLGTTNFSVGAL